MRYLYMFLVLLFLMLGACSSGDVSVTQTGNPTAVRVVYQIAQDTATPVVAMVRTRETTILSIHITSAKLLVHNILLIGEDTLDFRKTPPYILDVMSSDTTPVVLDSTIALSGARYDSLSLIIDRDTSEAKLLNDKSIVISGYTNGDTLQLFTFESEIVIEKKSALIAPLIVDETRPNRCLVILDVKQWFVDESGEYYDPHNPEMVEEIEESILRGIYGDEDHEVDEVDED